MLQRAYQASVYIWPRPRRKPTRLTPPQQSAPPSTQEAGTSPHRSTLATSPRSFISRDRHLLFGHHDDIKRAFLGGDDDGDDTLSVSEAVSAVEKLSGQSVSESSIESACQSCGIDTGREMDFNEFVQVVRHLEDNNYL
ncbi:hypothetical protein B0T26DRAFT_264977 [Lasiosphaeria miniovina]|uniref:EF-hand domain-containing protein n=1 Tax=Lasiosphaeria miniovina TaxID=1954250 RepID=A0AA40AX37_9PEZI|nr:uncharacterized protein B0T26DRAFT_264977 [Lasiosphaeria miniovina]KAK0723595.1 hypothetical protein B0T26DRAFT_264977 [Lasiosphaeria miniovina]